jgi:hypothetical protein
VMFGVPSREHVLMAAGMMPWRHGQKVSSAGEEGAIARVFLRPPGLVSDGRHL